MHPRRLFLELLVPSGLELFIAALASGAILVLSNATSLTSLFWTPDNRYYFRMLLDQYVGGTFGHVSQSAPIGRLTNFLIWAGAGAVTYLILWLVLDSYVELRNDVVVGVWYTSGSSRGHARYWVDLILRGLTRVGAVLLLLLLATVTIQVWYPVSIVMFRVWVNDFLIPANWAYMLVAFCGWLVVFHLATIFSRLTLLRTRLFA